MSTYLPYIAGTVLVLLGDYLIRHFKPDPETNRPSQRNEWKVKVEPAKPADYGYHYHLPAEGHRLVAIRIQKRGSSLTIKTLSITDAQFDERLAQTIAEAEERAATLNAAEVGV